jgi:sugar-specific transcriptional regulator TrmB
MPKEKFNPIEYELRKLDLDIKESRVYLVCLETGEISVQKISQATGYSRPTTYRILDTLEKKELIERKRELKKTQIIVKSPDSLLGLLRTQKRKIEEQEREFIRIISLLKNRYYLADNNIIYNYEGKEGLQFLLDDFSYTHSKEIFVLYPHVAREKMKLLEEVFEKIKHRLVKIEIKEIFPEKIEKSGLDFVRRKHLPLLSRQLSGILIACDKLYYFKENKAYSLVQENFVTAAREFVQIFWEMGKEI